MVQPGKSAVESKQFTPRYSLFGWTALVFILFGFPAEARAQEWMISKLAYVSTLAWPVDNLKPDCRSDNDFDCHYTTEYTSFHVKIRSGQQLKSTREIDTSFMPRWSPDGQKIAFLQYHNIHCPNVCITVANADGTHPRVVTNSTDYVENYSWSPRGETIAYLAHRGSPDLLLSTVTPDGTAGKDIEAIRCSFTNYDHRVWAEDIAFGRRLAQRMGSVEWSPDGQQIAFTGCTNGSVAVMAVKLETGKTRVIAVGHDGLWAPDGSKLLFVREIAGAASLWIANADGSGARMLVDHESAAGGFTWSSAGTNVVFASSRQNKKRSEIFEINVDGTGLHKIFPIKRDDRSYFFPILSPDSHKLLLLGSDAMYLVDLMTHRAKSFGTGDGVSVLWAQQ